jgi:hypothetical protein
MHPTMREAVVRGDRRELERKLRYTHHRREFELAEPAPPEPVLLRLSTVGDDEALARLAAFESRPAPRGQHVVAEVGGAVVAALPLGSGSLLADPFRRTASVVPLLELRAKQLTDDRARGRSRGVLRAFRALSRA